MVEHVHCSPWALRISRFYSINGTFPINCKNDYIAIQSTSTTSHTPSLDQLPVLVSPSLLQPGYRLKPVAHMATFSFATFAEQPEDSQKVAELKK